MHTVEHRLEVRAVVHVSVHPARVELGNHDTPGIEFTVHGPQFMDRAGQQSG
jgi:hypothetical protein